MPRTPVSFPSVAMLAGAVLAAGPAGADKFCATSPEEIKAALTRAESNGEDDLVMIAAPDDGWPVHSGEFGYRQSQSDWGRSLTIEGGYTNVSRTCGTRTDDPAVTILSGVRTWPALTLIVGPGSAVHVSNLTLTGGYRQVPPYEGAPLCGGGLLVTHAWLDGEAFAGRVTVQRNVFLGNAAESGGGLCVRGSQDIRVYNNVFADNAAVGPFGGALFLWDDDYWEREQGLVHVYNNTIVDNKAGDAGTGGALVAGGNRVELVANLLWGNLDRDVGLGINGGFNSVVHQAVLLHNNYDSSAFTTLPAYEGGRTRVTPDFVGSWVLAPNSPLVDGGLSGFVVTPLDINGQPRIAGAAVDVGAAEAPVVVRKKRR